MENPGLSEQDVKKSFIDAIEESGISYGLSVDYVEDPAPSIDRTIRAAEGLGATVKIQIEFPEA